MAEIELNAQGKGSRKACYRNEGMSPPVCHASLSYQKLSRELGPCSAVETSKQNLTWKIDRAMD
ncbi:hypothetical protein [Microvirga tunisiensis]|uniref:hypothetical protein n=1 Tax=Microvirga tunisiensis TaxID=2108360 RepID=UPI00128DD005|nr:hypothetical protein [Microvirga tunisiensis]MPR12811.1 hypothetical protein [Microvirga tunisiensis]